MTGSPSRRAGGGRAGTVPAGARGRTADLALPFVVGLFGTAALLALGIATGQANWAVYLTVLVLGAAGVALLHRRVGLSAPTVWGLVVFGLGHLAGGMVPVGSGTLYQWWLVPDVVRYDNLQHAVGFGVVGRATWEAMSRILAPVPEHRATVAWWVVVLGAGAFGAVNEVVEWVLTLTLESTNVGGYDNTVRDLLANLVGGTLVGWATAHEVRRAGRAHPRPVSLG
ncbi:hypothetical protein ACQE98_07445 [Ornithinimicrobium sp. W1679]|uniref:hypothetical protein n=1 Tax=Ornithinimicrobium sp. W1679 TaxID=3418770 RepID=UPI003CEFAC12